MPSKKSGGKRAVEKKHAERDAERNREAAGGDARQEWLERVKKLGKPPATAEKAHEWLGRAAVLIVQATMTDVGLPLEQMRRDAMRQIEQASKVLDPAKLSEQLAELEEALEKLEEQHHAGDVEARTNRPTSTGAPLC